MYSGVLPSGPWLILCGVIDMRALPALAYWEGLILVAGFFGIVLWKLLTGEINLSGLLEGDVRDPNSLDGYSTYVSAGRTQALIFTLSVALYYLLQVVHNPSEFPKVPTQVVSIFGGSQALYLGGKARAMLRGRPGDSLKR